MTLKTAAIAVFAAATALLSPLQAQAQTTAQGYDYASKFYPHPAWLYLRAEAPREMGEHPAVIIARQAREASGLTVAEASARVYPHPAYVAGATDPAHEMGQHPAVLVAQRAEAERQAAARAAHPVLIARR